MNIKVIIFTSLFSLTTSVLPSNPEYDPTDVQDWHNLQDESGKNFRMWQCCAIEQSKNSVQGDDKKTLRLTMLFKSHLCEQFTLTQLREMTQETLHQRYTDFMEKLQAKCAAKETKKERAQCLQGLCETAFLITKDNDALIYELTHGGTTFAKTQ